MENSAGKIGDMRTQPVCQSLGVKGSVECHGNDRTTYGIGVGIMGEEKRFSVEKEEGLAPSDLFADS